jgi:hypothetical protein
MQTGLVVRSHIRIGIFKSENLKQKQRNRANSGLQKARVTMSHGTLFRSVHMCVRIILNEGSTGAPLSHVVTCQPERKRHIQTLDAEFQCRVLLCYRGKHST